MKEKILNEVKQQLSPSNQGDKINAELEESLRETNKEPSKRNLLFTRRNERKKCFIENDHSFEEFSSRNDYLFPYLQRVLV